jgi:hypothetical protein
MLPTGYLRDAGGIKALSRRLSAATPPDDITIKTCIPAGCQSAHVAQRTGGSLCWHPFRMPALFSTNSGGIACAQPPAEGFDASGIGTETLLDSGY